MYLITIIFIFVLFIVFVDCGIFQIPALQTKNYLGIFIKFPLPKNLFLFIFSPTIKNIHQQQQQQQSLLSLLFFKNKK